MDCTWAVTAMISLGGAHKDRIKASRDGIVILVLTCGTYMDDIVHTRVLQSTTLAIRNMDLDLVEDGHGEEVEVDFARVLLDLMSGELGIVSLDHILGKGIAKEGCAVGRDDIRKFDRLNRRVLGHLNARPWSGGVRGVLPRPSGCTWCWRR